MNDRDLMFLPAHVQQEMVARGEISSSELTAAAFRRIAELDPKLNAFITLDEAGAMETATSMDKNRQSSDRRGLLHGIPVSLKDLESSAGMRSTFGSRLFERYIPDNDSGVALRVKAAGGIILGKTNTPEFGNREETFNDIEKPTCNPWDITRTAGGSSGGAAASIAAGMCSLGSGSDGGGSIRLPAAFSGIFGLKPSHGVVPRFGGVGNPALNPMATSGPMSNDVKDAAIMLQAVAGFDARDPGSLRSDTPDYLSHLEDGVDGLKIGFSLTMGYASVDDEVALAVEDGVHALQSIGAKVKTADLNLPSPRTEWWTIWTANQAAMYGEFYERSPEMLTNYTTEMVEHGLTVTGADYSRALRKTQTLRLMLDDFFERFDIIALPTTAATAWPHMDPPRIVGGVSNFDQPAGISFNAIPFTMLFNLSGHPAASVPCGFDSHGLPIGLQLVSRFGEDDLLLRLCRAFEKERPWSLVRPPVS